MKMTIQKTSEFTIDTAKERKRINNAFVDRPLTQKKLLKLMDLVEQEKWKHALKELESKWWLGRDKDQECPRLEFVGLLKSEGTNHWDSYIDLILRMNACPDVYKVMKKR